MAKSGFTRSFVDGPHSLPKERVARCFTEFTLLMANGFAVFYFQALENSSQRLWNINAAARRHFQHQFYTTVSFIVDFSQCVRLTSINGRLSATSKHVAALSLATMLFASVFAVIGQAYAEISELHTINVARPHGVAVDANLNKVYVADIESGEISVIDGQSHELLTEIQLSFMPSHVAVDSQSSLVYAAGSEGGLAIINSNTDTVIDTFDTGLDSSYDIEVNPLTERVFVLGMSFTDEDVISKLVIVNSASGALLDDVTLGFNIVPFGMAVNPVTDIVYISNSIAVTLVDGSSYQFITTVPLDGFSGAQGIGIDTAENKVYVASFGGTVTVIDGESNTVTGTVDGNSGSASYDVAVNEQTHEVYVTAYNPRTVSIIDGSNEVLTSEILLGSYSGPHGVAVNPQTNKAYVAGRDAGLVSVIDGQSQTVIDNIPVGLGNSPASVSVNPVTDRIYVAGNILNVIDDSTDHLALEVSEVAFPWGDIAIDTATNTVYATEFSGNLFAMDGESNEVLWSRFGVGSAVYGLAANPATGKIYAASFNQLSTTVVDGETGEILKTIRTGFQPTDLALNPVNNKIYVSNSDSNTISVIDGSTDSVVDTITVGFRPDELAVNPISGLVYVAAPHINTIGVIDGSTNDLVGTIELSFSLGPMVVNAPANMLYVGGSVEDSPDSFSGFVASINASSGEIVDTFLLANFNPINLAVDPVDGRIYVIAYAEDPDTFELVRQLVILEDTGVVTEPRPNRPPVAADDSAVTANGTGVAISVLDNDTDPDGDAFSIVGLTEPNNGAAQILPGNDTAIEYIPSPGFVGTDFFSYTISDGVFFSTAAVTVTVSVDGILDPLGTLTFRNELKLTLRDADQNIDSTEKDFLDERILVAVDAADGDAEILNLRETGDNTGVFAIAMTGSKLPVTFLSDGQLPVGGNGLLELRDQDIPSDIYVSYWDSLDGSGSESITSMRTTKVKLSSGSVHIPESAGPADDISLTLTDLDLNNDVKVKESYVLEIGADIYNLTRSGEHIGNLAYMKMELNGNPLNFGSDNYSYVLTETDVNTGSFKGTIRMSDIAASGNNGNSLSMNGGDQFKIIYFDGMGPTWVQKTDTMTISGGSTGTDVCQGLTATIVGTAGNDFINGTAGVDVIVGLAGDDTIYGLGGNDVICGNEGKDKIVGGPGNDKLSGDEGNDSLNGGGGKDTLIGGLNNDTLRGGGGDDNLSGGDGDDKLYGQAGVDVLDGGAGTNVLVQD